MPILDSQVHAYERNHPGRPWIGTLYGPPEVTGDQLVAAMDAVGVDGAILVSPFSMYRYDASYAPHPSPSKSDRCSAHSAGIFLRPVRRNKIAKSPARNIGHLLN